MGLESATKISDLNPLWPLGTDLKSAGDDHLRMIKNALVNGGVFPLKEQTSAPTTAADTGALYTKDVSSATELFYRRESSGAEIQMSRNGRVRSVNGNAVSNFPATAFADYVVLPTDAEKVDIGIVALSSNGTYGAYVQILAAGVPITGSYNGVLTTLTTAVTPTAWTTNVLLCTNVASTSNVAGNVHIRRVGQYLTIDSMMSFLGGGAGTFIATGYVDLGAQQVNGVRIGVTGGAMDGGAARILWE